MLRCTLASGSVTVGTAIVWVCVAR
jgi:hypothetical protein